MKTATFILSIVGAASALVARSPVGTETLIEYQRWCPVCDTVAMNYKCISAGASCQSINFMPPATDGAECTAACSAQCQLSYVANSDYGYTCNATIAKTTR
ncbi:hypothetical protein BD289DRAFT_484232 [Coniella lustricola]|uniref:Uncharacterized protein n=1 Tax=Coniella lustricola TaxID=2025994 RepID=A0A2T3A2Q3_9PEZI|nr:hypothetical protein BD289DRAFT_484232 [Coniella lustricola]